MPRYIYECEACLDEIYVQCSIAEHTSTIRHNGLCGGLARQILAVNFVRSMPEHYNNSLGSYVNNRQEFSDGLKRKSEEASLRTGMEHRYVPVDLTDMKGLGVTDEGLDHTRKVHHDSRPT